MGSYEYGFQFVSSSGFDSIETIDLFRLNQTKDMTILFENTDKMRVNILHTISYTELERLLCQRTNYTNNSSKMKELLLWADYHMSEFDTVFHFELYSYSLDIAAFLLSVLAVTLTVVYNNTEQELKSELNSIHLPVIILCTLLGVATTVVTRYVFVCFNYNAHKRKYDFFHMLKFIINKHYPELSSMQSNNS